jgi:hypothetical protein
MSRSCDASMHTSRTFPDRSSTQCAASTRRSADGTRRTRRFKRGPINAITFASSSFHLPRLFSGCLLRLEKTITLHETAIGALHPTNMSTFSGQAVSRLCHAPAWAVNRSSFSAVFRSLDVPSHIPCSERASLYRRLVEPTTTSLRARHVCGSQPARKAVRWLVSSFAESWHTPVDRQARL